MALTPEDVSNKRFTTVRLREGYDMTEVDQFLDEVEAELTRVTRENTELQAKLRAAVSGEPMPEPAEAAPEEPEPTVGADAEPTVVATPATPGEHLQVTTTAQASVAAARLLELAGSNADQLVAEATAQAEQIVGESRTRAEALETEARARAEALEAETAEHRATLLGDIDQEKARLDHEIETLRTFEREYRSELKTYFEDQLAALDGHGAGGTLAAAGRSESSADGDGSAQDDGQGDSQGDGQGGDGQGGDGEQTRLRSILDDDS